VETLVHACIQNFLMSSFLLLVDFWECFSNMCLSSSPKCLSLVGENLIFLLLLICLQIFVVVCLQPGHHCCWFVGLGFSSCSNSPAMVYVVCTSLLVLLLG
jgi:hypothetical protein